MIAAPGIAHFTHKPEWAGDGDHTCDLVDFGAFAGARVLIVGGRQSAYEWAALISEHGAEHIDVVHRHATAALRQGQLALRRPADRADARPPRLVPRTCRTPSATRSPAASGRSAA